MNASIIETPLRVSLVGKGGAVDGKRFGEAGRQLMGILWPEVRARNLRTTGINHWVYPRDAYLFTGVELTQPAQDLGPLERMDVEVPRYLRYVHQGPYSELPAAWKNVTDYLTGLGETVTFPSLEIYGHWNEDPSQLTTTLVVGLTRKSTSEGSTPA